MFWKHRNKDSSSSGSNAGSALMNDLRTVPHSPQSGDCGVKAEPASQRDIWRERNPGAYVIPKGYKVSGLVVSSRPVCIEGEAAGVVCSKVFVGETGRLCNPVEVGELIVAGCVEGVVQAGRSVELLAGGALSGEVKSPVMVVKPGGQLRDCRMDVAQLCA